MPQRTAAIVIDDFLSNDKWQYIQSNIESYLHTSEFVENKEEPFGQIIEWIKDKLKSIDVWNDHWDHILSEWAYINTLPSGIDRESSGSNGYHSEFGGFVYYIHPTWNSSWGGHLKFKDCDVSQIEPKPNRFVWVNPVVLHGIEVVNSNAEHNRITVVGWPEGCVEYDNATMRINIAMEDSN